MLLYKLSIKLFVDIEFNRIVPSRQRLDIPLYEVSLAALSHVCDPDHGKQRYRNRQTGQSKTFLSSCAELFVGESAAHLDENLAALPKAFFFN